MRPPELWKPRPPWTLMPDGSPSGAPRRRLRGARRETGSEVQLRRLLSKVTRKSGRRIRRSIGRRLCEPGSGGYEHGHDARACAANPSLHELGPPRAWYRNVGLRTSRTSASASAGTARARRAGRACARRTASSASAAAVAVSRADRCASITSMFVVAPTSNAVVVMRSTSSACSDAWRALASGALEDLRPPRRAIRTSERARIWTAVSPNVSRSTAVCRSRFAARCSPP